MNFGGCVFSNINVTIAVVLGFMLFTLSENSHAQKFEGVFKDPKNGLEWSKALSHDYRNGCTNDRDLPDLDLKSCTIVNGANNLPEVRTEDSSAAKACIAIGARLPTKAEYESLMSNFSTVTLNYGLFTRFMLTSEGLKQMQSIFKDMNSDSPYWDYNFWSSSIARTNPQDPNSAHSAYFFDPKKGEVLAIDVDRYDVQKVRCVRP